MDEINVEEPPGRRDEAENPPRKRQAEHEVFLEHLNEVQKPGLRG